MADLFDRFGGWITAIVVGALGLIGALLPKRGTLENTRIDQLQEDIQALREELKDQRTAAREDSARIDTLEQMLIWFRRRDVAWERREAELMLGAEQGRFPPWPERTGILTETRHD